jgi:putative transposase
MARRPRVVVPGVAHHVTQRGNNRQTVFFSDQDRIRYLHLLGEYAHRHGSRILGWCLMSNHVHLVMIPDTEKSLSLTLGQTHSQYAAERNRHCQAVGHVWQNRFYSCPLDTGHLFAALSYVDLNPVRAGMVSHAWAWNWSSARTHISPHTRDKLMDWPWAAWMEEMRLGAWNHSDWRAILSTADSPDSLKLLRRATQRGEPLGSDAFIQELEERAGRRLRVKPQGRPKRPKAIAVAG